MGQTFQKICEERKEPTPPENPIEPEDDYLDWRYLTCINPGRDAEPLPLQQRTLRRQKMPETPSGMKSSVTTDSIPLLQTTCEEPKDSTSQTDSIEYLTGLDQPCSISYSKEYLEDVWRQSLQETQTQSETPEQLSDITDSISLLQRIKRFFGKTSNRESTQYKRKRPTTYKQIMEPLRLALEEYAPTEYQYLQENGALRQYLFSMLGEVWQSSAEIYQHVLDANMANLPDSQWEIEQLLDNLRHAAEVAALKNAIEQIRVMPVPLEKAPLLSLEHDVPWHWRTTSGEN